MIHIRVFEALKPGVEHATVQFGPEGGSIGRAKSNTLVLDDPDCTVSRVHAQVVCRAGRYFIIDRGSNPLLHNGHTLGAGNEAPLSDGDRLCIGSFDLIVQVMADVAPASVADNFTQSISPATGGPSAEDDPFADLLAIPGVSPPATPESVVSPESTPGPFDDLLAPPPSPATPLGLDPPSSKDQGALDDFSDLITPAAQGTPSINSLFGIDTGQGGDPLAHSPLADPLHYPNTATNTDPLAALAGGTASPTSAPKSDHLPIGQFAFVPPQATSNVAPPSPPAPATPPAAPVSPANTDVLLAALLRGLDELRKPPDALTPELMERIGTLLRDAVQGTLQLLLTRQKLKRELRAEVTVIASQDNNPLKFSPTAEVALAHLLGPDMRGFMPSSDAMRDAFDDLRAHQFGVMVGMRAALTQLIARFAPDELKKRIVAKSAFDSLFTARRKAQLWDQFVQLYAEIATEAEDDFHSVFGKAFTQAYEEQMERLKSKNSG